MQAYLLHFNKPYKHARHYIGITSNLAWRLRRHKSGRGAVLLRYALADGVRFIVAREWFEEDKPAEVDWYTFEKRLKARHSVRICPKCRAEAAKAKKRERKQERKRAA